MLQRPQLTPYAPTTGRASEAWWGQQLSWQLPAASAEGAEVAIMLVEWSPNPTEAMGTVRGPFTRTEDNSVIPRLYLVSRNQFDNAYPPI